MTAIRENKLSSVLKIIVLKTKKASRETSSPSSRVLRKKMMLGKLGWKWTLLNLSYNYRQIAIRSIEDCATKDKMHTLGLHQGKHLHRPRR